MRTRSSIPEKDKVNAPSISVKTKPNKVSQRSPQKKLSKLKDNPIAPNNLEISDNQNPKESNASEKLNSMKKPVRSTKNNEVKKPTSKHCSLKRGLTATSKGEVQPTKRRKLGTSSAVTEDKKKDISEAKNEQSQNIVSSEKIKTQEKLPKVNRRNHKVISKSSIPEKTDDTLAKASKVTVKRVSKETTKRVSKEIEKKVSKEIAKTDVTLSKVSRVTAKRASRETKKIDDTSAKGSKVTAKRASKETEKKAQKVDNKLNSSAASGKTVNAKLSGNPLVQGKKSLVPSEEKKAPQKPPKASKGKKKKSEKTKESNPYDFDEESSEDDNGPTQSKPPTFTAPHQPQTKMPKSRVHKAFPPAYSFFLSGMSGGGSPLELKQKKEASQQERRKGAKATILLPLPSGACRSSNGEAAFLSGPRESEILACPPEPYEIGDSSVEMSLLQQPMHVKLASTPSEHPQPVQKVAAHKKTKPATDGTNSDDEWENAGLQFRPGQMMKKREAVVNGDEDKTKKPASKTTEKVAKHSEESSEFDSWLQKFNADLKELEGFELSVENSDKS